MDHGPAFRGGRSGCRMVLADREKDGCGSSPFT
nr:MAG TPA: hypothetical protein [Caudoviricetes sp.]